MSSETVPLETISRLAKHRGFIFPGSEIYGGLANSWDYGPLGVLLKNNIRDAWWRHFVQGRDDMTGLDAAILMNPKVWEASGHVANFNDPMVEDTVTHKRYRADHLLEEHGVVTTDMDLGSMQKKLEELDAKSPDGNSLTAPKVFNLLFETSLGSVEGKKSAVYLRGELAQSMFVDFKRVMESQRMKLPFGIAQVGRVFRNEITPGNFTFRTLEFDLMEFEYFIREDEWESTFDYWLEEMQRWVTEDIGIGAERLRVREHADQERSHYSKRTADIEYETSFGGWKELFGLAYRGDYDLRQHAEASGADLQVLDAESGEKFFPHVVEPTFGLTRLLLMVMLDAYSEEQVKGETRVVMKFKPEMAPYQAAVLPLSNKPELIAAAKPLVESIRKLYSCDFDVTQSIGKRYRRQDEIGTPYCVTVDFDSLEDGQVTVRDRDSMEQERVLLENIGDVLKSKFQDPQDTSNLKSK